jgi:hypothetical protein
VGSTPVRSAEECGDGAVAQVLGALAKSARLRNDNYTSPRRQLHFPTRGCSCRRRCHDEIAVFSLVDSSTGHAQHAPPRPPVSAAATFDPGVDAR